MKVIIDRIENNIAVAELENGKVVNVPLELFEGAAEGDAVEIIVKKAEKETLEIRKLMNDVWED